MSDICADVGGHTRPVYVLENLWKLPLIDRAYWHSPNDRYHKLLEEGVIVYLDVEEITKQSHIAVSVEIMIEEEPLYGAFLLQPDNPLRQSAIKKLYDGKPLYRPEGEYVYDDHVVMTESIPNEFRHGVCCKPIYTHCEISGDLATGIIGGTLTFASNTNSARNLFAKTVTALLTSG